MAHALLPPTSSSLLWIQRRSKCAGRNNPGVMLTWLHQVPPLSPFSRHVLWGKAAIMMHPQWLPPWKWANFHMQCRHPSEAKANPFLANAYDITVCVCVSPPLPPRGLHNGRKRGSPPKVTLLRYSPPMDFASPKTSSGEHVRQPYLRQPPLDLEHTGGGGGYYLEVIFAAKHMD